jgi:ABC-type amino acid transport substrate-binding protein
MNRAVRVLAVLLILAGIQPSSLADSPASIKVVLDDNYPPYSFRDADGKLTGYVIDLWQNWERQTGVKVVLEATDWVRAQALMQAGQADVIDTVFETPERRQQLDFSEPYADLPVSIYVHNDIEGIVDLATLQGFLVGVKNGDACADWLNQRGLSRLEGYANFQALVAAARL